MIFKKPTKNQIIALSGIFQSCHLVDQLSRYGLITEEELKNNLQVLFNQNTKDIYDIYGSIETLHHGVDAIKNFIDKPEFSALRSVHEMSESAYKNFEISEDGCLMSVFSHMTDLDNSNMGRQFFPKTFVPNGYVDVLNTSFIREYNLLHGNKVMAYITDAVTEIDSVADFNFLRYQISVDSATKETIFNSE